LHGLSPFPEILRRAKSGDERAVALLFRDAQPDLLRYLRARAPGDAEDIASQTWLEVARRLRSFEGDHDAFRAWVFTIASRRLANWRRSFSRRRADAAPRATFEAVTSGEETEQLVVDGLSGEEAAQLVARLLPRRQAEVVLLRVLGGMTAEEVGAATGRSAGAVRVL
jgi:RNA polymerase sigma-70 factor (ECF subfamily)